jgi:uncharacterized membrane protein
MRASWWIGLGFAAGGVVMGMVLYPQLPERMATHWGFGNEPDGFMSKKAALLTIGIIGVVVWVITAMPMMLNKQLRDVKGWSMLDVFMVSMCGFIFYGNSLVLVYNTGAHISVPAWLFGGVIALFAANAVGFVYLWRYGTSVPSAIATGAVLYSDKLIEITEDTILFHGYYFPCGSKRVGFGDVEKVEAMKPTLFTGKWRLSGTGDFVTWFPADYGRFKRDTIFHMQLKNGRRIGFTAIDSNPVKAILSQKQVLKVNCVKSD